MPGAKMVHGARDEEQAALRDHVAPGRDLRRRAGAEERERGLDQDRGGADVGRLHDQRRDRVRQDVAQQDLPRRRAARDGGLDVGRSRTESTTARTRRTTRGTSGMVIAKMTVATLARVSATSAMASRMAGDRHQPVHQPHHDGIHLAEIAGHQADEEPDRDRHGRDRDADEQRDARAIDRAGEDVAAEMVGAEPVIVADGGRRRSRRAAS